jgi:signal transduction histidine kinase
VRILGSYVKRNVTLFIVGEIVFAIVCTWPLWMRAPGFAIFPILVSLSFSSTALLLKDDVGRGGTTSLLLFVAGLLWPTAYLFEWSHPLTIILSMVGNSAFWWISSAASLLYPQQQLERIEKIYLVFLGLGVALPDFYMLTTNGPHDESPYFSFLTIIFGVAFLVIAIVRARRYGKTERRTLLPVLTVTTVLALAGGVSWSFLLLNGIYTPEANQHVIDYAYLVQSIMLFVLPPVGFIVGGLRRRFIQAAVAEALARLAPGSSIEELREALRLALQDERLDVLYLLPSGDAYINTAGQVVAPPQGSSDKISIQVRTGVKEQLALLVVDRQLAHEAALFGDAVSVPRKPVLTAWLQAYERAHDEKLRPINWQVEKERWKERQRIGRDLHDRVQQQLTVLLVRLAEAQEQADGHPVSRTIRQASQHLRATVGALRDTIQGFASAELEKCGLAPALYSLIEQQVIEVRARLSSDRAPLGTELIAFFVACEAFTNIAKHASASCVILETMLSNNVLVVKIVDDGVGGADMGKGTGLAGLHHRVKAVGGSLEIKSHQGDGTEIIVRIPCV